MWVTLSAWVNCRKGLFMLCAVRMDLPCGMLGIAGSLKDLTRTCWRASSDCGEQTMSQAGGGGRGGVFACILTRATAARVGYIRS
jgi:hypothetical protein